MARSEKQGFAQLRGRPWGGGRRPRARKSLWILSGIVVLGVVIIVASTTGCASNDQTTPKATETSAVTASTGPVTPTTKAETTTTAGVTSSTLSATTSTAEGTTTTASTAADTFSEGIYLVGTDIHSGLYRGTVNEEAGHWEISSDANGQEFVASADPTGPFYVKVKSGQYLTLSGVTIARAGTTTTGTPLSSNITDGTYRVGTDIAAGRYVGTVNDRMGYWEISSDANGQTIIPSDIPMGPFSVEVESGQYLTVRGVTISQ